MDVRGAGGGLDLRLRGAWPAVADVVADGVVEEHGVLRHDADGAAHAVLRHVAQVLAVDGDAATAVAGGRRVHVVETVEQPRQRALARTGRPDHRDRLPARDLETHVVQDRPVRVVREVHRLEAHGGVFDRQRLRTGPVGDLALALHQAEHLVQVGQALLDLAVEHAQEVQRDVELDQQRVHHHQVAQRQAVLDHAGGGAPEHRHQARRNDELLARVEQGERALRLDLGAAVGVQALVVAAGLEVLVVEVLDGLVVQQRVDGAAVRLRVQLVHLAAELGAPLGEADGQRAIGNQRGQRDPHEAHVELAAEQRQHQRQLDQRRHDGVERVAHQRLQRARAALDVAGHAAGLAVEVEAQAERVQVAEGLQRDAPRRAVGGLGEDQFAQLGEDRGRQPQPRIGQQQPQRHDHQRPRIADRDRQAVHQLLQQQRHAHVRRLGRDDEHQRQHHAHAVFPQVGAEALQRRPVAAGRAGGIDRGGFIRGEAAHGWGSVKDNRHLQPRCLP